VLDIAQEGFYKLVNNFTEGKQSLTSKVYSIVMEINLGKFDLST